MSKGKRMKESNTSKKILKFFIYLILLIIVAIIILYFLAKSNKITFLENVFNKAETDSPKSSLVDNTSQKAEVEENKSTKAQENNNSKVESLKTIKGLEDIKISNLSIDNSASLSVITISIENTSDKKIESKKCHLSLYNDKNEILFGTTVKLPGTDAKEKKDFKIICGSTISNVSDYKLEIEEEKNTSTEKTEKSNTTKSTKTTKTTKSTKKTKSRK